jgi:3-hydroxyacyl-CoA dehydrogenase
MGHGIAQVTAQANYQVLAIEMNEKALDTGIQRIKDSLKKVISRDIKKGLYDEKEGEMKINHVFTNISTSMKLESLKDCDLIIEAIAENLPLKLDFYKKLSTIAQPTCVFASNTSSLAITQMAEVSGRADKFVGLHFFNPVQIMKLVEVIRTKHTNNEVYDAMKNFSNSIGKTAVSCGDTPGFIVNRLLVPYLAQSMSMLERGDASAIDIDVSMKLGAGHPMGPLELADYIGLDTALHILEGWVADFPNETAFFIPDILKAKVKAGHFGRKTGKGFYKWDGDKCLHEVV